MTYEELLDKWLRKLGRPCTAGEIVHDLRQLEQPVRCIECKHCSWADHYDALIAVDPLNYCPGVFDYFCDYFDMETEEDGYCAWGERREDAQSVL